MVVLEEKVEQVDKKQKYKNKIKKAKEVSSVITGKKRKNEAVIDVKTEAPPTIESPPKKPKKDKSILKDNKDVVASSPDKKSIKFNETVKVKEITGNAPEKKKKKKQLDGKIKDKKDMKIFKKDKDGEKAAVVKLDKKETREKQKKDKAERRAKKIEQDVYNLSTEAKKIWEKVRVEEDMKGNEQKKAKLTTELHALVKGNLKKIIFAHDTVRVVECLMAMGSEEIKNEIYLELKEDMIEMAKSKYANFFVQKLLKYGSKEQKQAVMKSLEGRIAKLMKHKTAGVVVELMYNDYADAKTRNRMLQEFLGPEYELFKEEEVRTVSELVAKHPEKKDEIIKNLGANVDVLIQKGTFNHSLVHTVIHNYLTVVEGKKRADCIEAMRDNLVHILHSRDGAMASLHCLWHGTTKDRKAIIKSLKTFVEKTCLEEYGHLVLLAIFDTVDDTKLVGKAILGELAECFDKVILDKYGVRVIKYLVAGRDSVYTSTDTVKLMVQGDGNQQSKKDPVVRRRELTEVVNPTILRWIGERMLAGLYDGPMTITFTCLLNHLPASDQLTKVWAMLAEEASKPFIVRDATPNIIENTASNMLLKKIILKDKERHAAGVEMFSKMLMSTVDQDGVEAWLSCNRGAFLLVYCWETEVEEVQALVREKVKPVAKILKRQAAKLKGASILSTKLE